MKYNGYTIESGANLRAAYLRGANLSNASLYGANLRAADLRGANLRAANLRGANLRGANLYGANLRAADLRGADLHGADLSNANLYGADLSGADLRNADLSGANLSGANLRDVTLDEDALWVAQTRILPDGDIIGWKKCLDGVIVKLLIPAAAKRSSAFGRKCRAEYVTVLDVFGDSVGESRHDAGRTVYRKSETVRPDKWSDDWKNECDSGIHFFITRAEAEAY